MVNLERSSIIEKALDVAKKGGDVSISKNKSPVEGYAIEIGEVVFVVKKADDEYLSVRNSYLEIMQRSQESLLALDNLLDQYLEELS